ncbi:MAG: MotA/TolQ/ExbB proton channel family protein [Nitrospirae bacterium]|nr:MAG: MotA/TolQ/ExbB proton channel family protein [Nitrospirota bacterium]
MWPLLLASILSLAILLDRARFLRRNRVVPPFLLDQVRARLLDGKREEALAYLRQDGSPMARVLAAGVAARERRREVVRDRLEDAGRHQLPRLEAHLNTLGIIAGVSPLLGLLGTVSGMIKVFNTIAQQGVGQAGALAGGISEALFSTAMGLLVAIPAFIAYRYFRHRAEVLAVEMERVAMELLDFLTEQEAPA